METKDIFSTTQVATILGISRIAVFKNIKSGKIRGQKIGRNYIIKKEDLIEDILRDALPLNASDEEKAQAEEEIRKSLETKINNLA